MKYGYHSLGFDVSSLTPKAQTMHHLQWMANLGYVCMITIQITSIIAWRGVTLRVSLLISAITRSVTASKKFLRAFLRGRLREL
jgi:hypothetical protein